MDFIQVLKSDSLYNRFSRIPSRSTVFCVIPPYNYVPTCLEFLFFLGVHNIFSILLGVIIPNHITGFTQLFCFLSDFPYSEKSTCETFHCKILSADSFYLFCVQSITIYFGFDLLLPLFDRQQKINLGIIVEYCPTCFYLFLMIYNTKLNTLIVGPLFFLNSSDIILQLISSLALYKSFTLLVIFFYLESMKNTFKAVLNL